MNKLMAALILPALFASAAAGAATLTLQSGETGTLGKAQVTLLRLEDSRCPTDAQCIRAGELRLSLLVTEGGRSRFLKLSWPEAGNVPQAGGIRVLKVPGRKASDRRAPPVTLTDTP